VISVCRDLCARNQLGVGALEQLDRLEPHAVKLRVREQLDPDLDAGLPRKRVALHDLSATQRRTHGLVRELRHYAPRILGAPAMNCADCIVAASTALAQSADS